VKKITSYITKKVADKLEELFKEDRKGYEEKWPSMSVITKYGMISDEKFSDRVKDICLLENSEGELFTIEEYREKVQVLQTNKEDNVIFLYTSHPEDQHSFIDAAKERSYDVLHTDEIIDNHFMAHIEQKEEKIKFIRVDSDTVDKLIEKDEATESILSDSDKEKLKTLFEEQIGSPMVKVDLRAMSPTDPPATIVKPEMMRRMRDMAAISGMDFMGGMPEETMLVLNTNHPVNEKILSSRGDNKNRLVKQLYDLARLSQKMLTGEELTDFVRRSVDLMGKK
jgi:molecular chaperone HtpG